MNKNTPHVGDTARVHTGDGTYVETTVHSVCTGDQCNALLFHGEPGEQYAKPDINGYWWTEESGHQVTFRRPQAEAKRKPNYGDFTTRVLHDASLLYRVHFATEDGNSAGVEIVGDPLGYATYDSIYFEPTNGTYRWPDGEEAVFTNGNVRDLALAATRLTTMRQSLRDKYFDLEKETEEADRDGAHGFTVGAMRDRAADIAEQLFLLETGLDPANVYAYEKFQEFHEALHDEYLASKEK